MSNDTLASLYGKVTEQFKIDPSRKSEWALFTDRTRKGRILDSRNTRVKETVAHGDLIYLMPLGENGSKQGGGEIEDDDKEEDEVDLELAKQDGKINRERDEQLCEILLNY